MGGLPILDVDETVSSYWVSSDLQHRDNTKRPFRCV